MSLFSVGNVAVIEFDVALVATGLPTDPTAIVLTIVSPTGVTTQPTPVHDGLGSYAYELALTEAGDWYYSWTTSGTAAAFADGTINVRAPGSTVIQLADVKARLNKTLDVDDDEIQQMLDAAIAEYETYFGPVSGTVTETFDGGGTTLVLRQPVSAISAASYDSGTTLTYTDLTVANGIVRWGYGTTGRFLPGRVSITYTVGALPANHREVIIADVAGYFAHTQQGTAGPAVPDQGYAETFTSQPIELFPRIRALAASYPTVA